MTMLTVFTPTYNRADMLENGFKALKRQTCKDFEWLIIDDGSTDNTKEVVSKWVDDEKEFHIRYYFKENGGLHTGYNEAIKHLETELAVCIDSDDYMPDDAVEKIIDKWKRDGSDEYAGIAGLDYTVDGMLLGDKFPDKKSINLIDVTCGREKIKWGDRKLVLRSELYKSVAPMKVFEGEKHFNPNYLHMEVAKKYDYLVLNENLCFVDYQPEGMSSNIWRQYMDSPRSFAELRKQHLSFENMTLRYKFKEYVHYYSCCFLAKKSCGLKHKNPLLVIPAIPAGFLLSRYVLYKGK